LQAFSPEETERYVEHRLRVAGYNSDRPIFTRSAMQLIAQHSEGIPRNINTLCFNALSIGCALRRRTIDADIVREVISDLDLAPLDQVMADPTEAATEQATPAPASIRSIPSFAGWAVKGALATTFLLVLTGMRLPSGPHAMVLADARGSATSNVKRAIAPPVSENAHPSVLPDAREPASPAISPASPKPPARSRATTSPAPVTPIPDARKVQGDAQERILVPPGVTLYEICRETMKNCRSKDIAAIRRLNPWLTDPNHLESGRTLHIPLLPQVAVEAAVSQSAESTKEVPK
jgi:hypothetical protein